MLPSKTHSESWRWVCLKEKEKKTHDDFLLRLPKCYDKMDSISLELDTCQIVIWAKKRKIGPSIFIVFQFLILISILTKIFDFFSIDNFNFISSFKLKNNKNFGQNINPKILLITIKSNQFFTRSLKYYVWTSFDLICRLSKLIWRKSAWDKSS